MSNFTERMIVESFMKLLEQKNFDKITVKDIIEETGISRNTFYYHYADIYDLAKKVATQEFERIYQFDFAHANWKDVLKEATYEAKQSKKQLYHIINALDRKQLESYLYTIAYKVIEIFIHETMPEMEIKNDEQELVMTCYSCALVGVTMKWIDDGMPAETSFVEKASAIFTGSLAFSMSNIK